MGRSWADPPSRHSISDLGDCFYGGESFPRFGYAVSFPRVDVASEVKEVVYRMSEIWFAAEIASSGRMSALTRTESALAHRRDRGTAWRRSCGAMCSKPALSQQVLTTYQTTFCEMPFPHTLPILATARKIRPSLTPAAAVH